MENRDECWYSSEADGFMTRVQKAALAAAMAGQMCPNPLEQERKPWQEPRPKLQRKMGKDAALQATKRKQQKLNSPKPLSTDASQLPLTMATLEKV